MLPKPRIHLIERANQVWKLQDSDECESGNWWRIGRPEADALIGGHLYLHSAQAEPSRDGGVIMGYRVQEGGRHAGRYIFRFKHSERHVGVIATGRWQRYKQIVLVSMALIALLSPFHASAEMKAVKRTADSLKMAENFLRDKCSFAVAFVDARTKVESDIYGGGVAVDLLCIFDGKVNTGTIRERNGCTMGMLNANSGYIGTVISPLVDPMTDGKSCSKETVERVLRGELKVPGYHINREALGGPDVRSAWDFIRRKFQDRYDLVIVVNEFNVKVPQGARTIRRELQIRREKESARRMEQVDEAE